MEIRNAEAKDMKLLGHIMVVSFRHAFSSFISQRTMDENAREDCCTELLENLYAEGKMHFLIAGSCGMLVWQRTDEGAEIVAIHSLPESWGSGVGQAMLEKALEQIGQGTVFLWAFKENARARRFYEKNGFRVDGNERISDYDGAIEVRYVRENGNG